MAEHDFLQHLKNDHEEQKTLGKQLIEAKSPGERDRLRKKFYNSLYPHMIGEEASIFELLKNAEDEEAKDDGLEGIQEHHVGKLVMKELMELSLDSEVFKAKASVLDELNRHHIEEEEEDVFGHVKKMCNEQDMNRLFSQYEEAEERAKQ